MSKESKKYKKYKKGKKGKKLRDYCKCRKFNEKAMDKRLKSHEGETIKLCDFFKECSGGKAPKCAKCIPFIHGKVQKHNKGFN
jgi:hypothetical protein